jgi:hypothetical protein
MLGFIDNQSRSEKIMESFADELRHSEKLGGGFLAQAAMDRNMGIHFLDRSAIAAIEMAKVSLGVSLHDESSAIGWLSREAKRLSAATEITKAMMPISVSLNVAQALKPMRPNDIVDSMRSQFRASVERMGLGAEPLELPVESAITREPPFSIHIPKRRSRILKLELQCVCAFCDGELKIVSKAVEYPRGRIKVMPFCGPCLANYIRDPEGFARTIRGDMPLNIRPISGSGTSDGKARGKLHLVQADELDTDS